jgi:hypothetical protein
MTDEGEDEVPETEKSSTAFPVDNLCRLLLLKGVCLRCKKSYSSANECFSKIMGLKGSIKRDSYLPPHATLELGVTLAEIRDFAAARTYLEMAKTEYKGFLVEVIVHLRIHAAMREMTALEAASGKKSHSLTSEESPNKSSKSMKEKKSVINGSSSNDKEPNNNFNSNHGNSSKSAPTSPAGDQEWVMHPLKFEQL